MIPKELRGGYKGYKWNVAWSDKRGEKEETLWGAGKVTYTIGEPSTADCDLTGSDAHKASTPPGGGKGRGRGRNKPRGRGVKVC